MEQIIDDLPNGLETRLGKRSLVASISRSVSGNV